MPGPWSPTRTRDLRALELRADLDRAAGRGVLRGVVEDVDQHLLDQHRIGVEQRHGRRDRHPQAMRCQRLGELPGRAADDLAQVDPVAVRLQRAVAEAGHVEQVLDEAIEPLALLEDGLQQLGAILARERGLAAGEAGGRADDRDQGRAQVVGDRGEQRRAQPLGLGQAAARPRCRWRGWCARSRPRPGPRRHRAAGAARASARAAAARTTTPSRPIAPRPVPSGRNSHSEPGSVSEPQPAGWPCSQAQRAAAQAVGDIWSSGG